MGRKARGPVAHHQTLGRDAEPGFHQESVSSLCTIERTHRGQSESIKNGFHDINPEIAEYCGESFGPSRWGRPTSSLIFRILRFVAR